MSIEAYRARHARALKNTLVRERPLTPTSDGKGGRIPGSSSSLEIACSVSSTNGRRGEDQEQIKALGAWVIRVPAHADIQAGDLVTLLGSNLKITWAPPLADQQLTRTVRAEEKRP